MIEEVNLMIKVVDVLLASNYSVVALKLEGNQVEMCELGSKILGQNFKGGG